MNARLTCLFLLAASASVLAQDPDADAEFLLWTRNNRFTQDHLFTGNSLGLAASNYDSSKPTKIFAHGWRMNGYGSTATDMRDAYLATEDCNFISVNWEKLASPTNYYAAAPNVNIVGSLTADFVNFLVAQGTPLRNVHLIGFSLGAHVVGNAGMGISGTVPRITGLDPAYPDFTVEDTSTRLDTSDAAFVDIIHTASGTLTELCLSFPVPIGHVDFWPNGDPPQGQPGCALPGPDIIDIASSCSHGRAPEYFTESVRGGTAFVGTKCTSYTAWTNGLCANGDTANMGYPVSNTASGNYYLNTNNQSPYALG